MKGLLVSGKSLEFQILMARLPDLPTFRVIVPTTHPITHDDERKFAIRDLNHVIKQWYPERLNRDHGEPLRRNNIEELWPRNPTLNANSIIRCSGFQEAPKPMWRIFIRIASIRQPKQSATKERR
jgi:hypothetical protein